MEVGILVFAPSFMLPLATNWLVARVGDETPVETCAKGFELLVPGDGSSAFRCHVMLTSETNYRLRGQEWWTSRQR